MIRISFFFFLQFVTSGYVTHLDSNFGIYLGFVTNFQNVSLNVESQHHIDSGAE